MPLAKPYMAYFVDVDPKDIPNLRIPVMENIVQQVREVEVIMNRADPYGCLVFFTDEYGSHERTEEMYTTHSRLFKTKLEALTYLQEAVRQCMDRSIGALRYVLGLGMEGIEEAIGTEKFRLEQQERDLMNELSACFEEKKPKKPKKSKSSKNR